MRMNGTSFQKLVWRELLSIPLGETRTYKQIADAIGKPSSSRAVANACAANPYAPFVPCHRVIGRQTLVVGPHCAMDGA